MPESWGWGWGAPGSPESSFHPAATRGRSPPERHNSARHHSVPPSVNSVAQSFLKHIGPAAARGKTPSGEPPRRTSASYFGASAPADVIRLRRVAGRRSLTPERRHGHPREETRSPLRGDTDPSGVGQSGRIGAPQRSARWAAERTVRCGWVTQPTTDHRSMAMRLANTPSAIYSAPAARYGRPRRLVATVTSPDNICWTLESNGVIWSLKYGGLKRNATMILLRHTRFRFNG